MTKYTGTSLRCLEKHLKSSDTITNSVLIGPEPDSPCFSERKNLTFINCKFFRCIPPGDSKLIECRFDQTPLPTEPEPQEIFTVEKNDLIPVIKAARDGKVIDITKFCEKHGITLKTLTPEIRQ